VERLVVVAIIGLLLATLLPVVATLRAKARQTAYLRDPGIAQRTNPWGGDAHAWRVAGQGKGEGT
jgi:hypothetical protein